MPVSDADGNLVTPELVLRAYALGLFPMGTDRRDRLAWYAPRRRAIITWDRFAVPRSLRKVRRRRPFALTRDRAFDRVIAACADRPDTWICEDIETVYRELHRRGHAHSFEAWDVRGDLVGGLYGLGVGRVFSGESMFHSASDAAKLCVVELVDWLRTEGFALLDCQQQSEHMRRFGAYEVTQERYLELLADGLA